LNHYYMINGLII